MVRLAMLLSALLLAACGTATRHVPSCASSCAGCCDAQDVCQFGTLHDACGAQGGACSACGEHQSCAQGLCGLDVFGTGGGGAGGGPGDAGP